MQAFLAREAVGRRRARMPCPKCGRVLDLARMRAHLRDGHRLATGELETAFLLVRRTALRGRALRRA
jgi:hypothetical protein